MIRFLQTSEKTALDKIYSELNGGGWTDDTNWNSGSDPCTSPVPIGVTCTGGSVTGLDLSENGLSGTIPTEIGYLTSLVSEHTVGYHVDILFISLNLSKLAHDTTQS